MPLNLVGLVPDPYYNVRQYGALGNGSTDDTAAIQAAVAAASSGGIVFFPSGTYFVTTPLVLSNPNVQIMGCGIGSIIQAKSGFSGAQLVLCSGNFTGVCNIQLSFNAGPASSNPAADAIKVSGAVGVVCRDLFMQYINGYVVNSVATSSNACSNLILDNIHGYLCAQGVHTQGVSGSSWMGVQHFLNCNMDGGQNGDCYLFEDISDVICTNILGSNTAGSGVSARIKGKCAAIYLENVDFGPYPGPSTGNIVSIESGSNGTPNQCSIRGGIVEGGLAGVNISAATNIEIVDLQIYNNGTYGINISGSSDGIQINNCNFNGNGSAGSSGRYDIQSSTTLRVAVDGCMFQTAQGSTAGKTNNVGNITAGTVIFQNCQFIGTGYNGGNIFNNYPYLITNCLSFNPVGNITAPTIGASPYTAPKQSYDCMVYIKGGTVSAISVGGTATGLTLATGGFVSVLVPAQTQIIITYSAAPTWTWFGL